MYLKRVFLRYNLIHFVEVTYKMFRLVKICKLTKLQIKKDTFFIFVILQNKWDLR